MALMIGLGGQGGVGGGGSNGFKFRTIFDVSGDLLTKYEPITTSGVAVLPSTPILLVEDSFDEFSEEVLNSRVLYLHGCAYDRFNTTPSLIYIDDFGNEYPASSLTISTPQTIVKSIWNSNTSGAVKFESVYTPSTSGGGYYIFYVGTTLNWLVFGSTANSYSEYVFRIYASNYGQYATIDTKSFAYDDGVHGAHKFYIEFRDQPS